ncbi:MAG TPA: IPT/TIG domain-containing protein, partial [Bryobacteraceae bacterium]|nr:IPT/TIG domain-containing protein [Bryobacteraceae bacterium]
AFSWRRLLRVLSPYGGLTVVYFITRWIAMRGTTPFAQAGNYAPTLDLNRALSHLVLYAGDFLNISLANPWIHGTGSFATLFGLPSPHTWERTFLAGGALLFLVTVVPALVRDARVWSGLCLTGAFIAPTLLVGLAQTYYLLVPLAGVAMALAVSLSAWSQGPRRVLTVLWTAVVLVCVVNCWVMRRNVEGLFWYSAGNAARQAYQSMIEPEKDRPIRSLTLMVADPSIVWYWKWVLDPFSTPGLVQALANKPHLEFRVQEFDLTKARLLVGEVSPVYFLRDGTFAKFADLVIKAGGPLQTRAGQRFNVQPDGTSAIWLQTENVPRSSVVILGDRRLPSMVAGATAVSCTVPRELYAKPGKYPIYVEDALTGRRSNALQFTVAP